MGVLPEYMSMYHIYAWCSLNPEEGTRNLELKLNIVVNHHMGPGNWTGPLQEQPVHLTMEPSLQAYFYLWDTI